MGPSKDFISKSERTYQCRSLISWGDLVKLNFNPKLEQLAIDYVCKQAKMFNGLRIDNAHNTNQEVLQKILKEAKKVNTNLLVMLEIFSGDENHDGYLTQVANGDITLKEMVHYDSCDKLAGLVLNSSFRQGINLLNQYKQPISYNIHAPKFLFDITHDNIPFGNHSSHHNLSNFLSYAFIGAFAQGTAYASTYGSDQGITDHIEVICKNNYAPQIPQNMIAAKKFLLKQREVMANYEEIYADNHGDFLTIERSSYNDKTQFFLLAIPDFKDKQFDQKVKLTIPGIFTKTLFFAGKKQSQQSTINGFNLNDFVELKNGSQVNIKQNQFDFEIQFDANSGDVLVLEKKSDDLDAVMSEIKAKIAVFKREFAELGVAQTKYFLALSELEEIELTGMKLFDFQGLRPTMCGFDGLKDCIITQNVDSVVANCLRSGNWFYDYILQRNSIHKFNLTAFDELVIFVRDKISSYSKPKCTFELFQALDKAIDEEICKMLKISYDKLAPQLYRAGLLLISFRPQWSNVDVNKWLTEDFKKTISNQDDSVSSVSEPESTNSRKHRQSKIMWKHVKPANPLVNISLCAGFPHFFDGMFRSWGRDIALGLTGMVPDQISRRVMIVSTASLLRHGLLPNLQDSGRIPRYNCRDSVWFWLCNVVEYIEEFGNEILNDTVKRIFLRDDQEAYYFDEVHLQYLYKQEVLAQINQKSREMTISDVILEILTKHWQGIDFMEWKCHDDNMRPEGKHVTAYTDQKTGLVYGGNEYNCHTWMDKMGGSQLCGNRGIPASARCGAAIEINLCARKVLLVLKKQYNHDFIQTWQTLIEKNIFTYKAEKNGFKYAKDVISYRTATNNSQDFLLRPNLLIGLSFQEPSFIKLFEDEILTCYAHLQDRFSIGMKTLAPFETRYTPWYNNDDMTSFETGNGFSYHNGPEWVHCNGRGLICLKKINKMDVYERVLVNIRRHMDLHCNVNVDYRSLPELTQANADICINSCLSQSWALGSVLQAMTIK
ncbi:Glycogen debranching enzyme [Spironucleus salmonicida]|nr:Glycogen debranching enzyme [Spironucleus salmonicida]